ncbi:MAG: cell division protein ZapA [Bacteroidales bacterium]|nr:cell division protein ZapA [Bacteroidales bacterium]
MKQRITLKIAGRDSEFMVDPAKEEQIRAAAARINKEYESVRYDYRNQDPSDVLRMILLSEELKLIEAETRNSQENSSLIRRLEELDAGLKEYLSR